ncbi:sensor histidine kinase [Embleya sp. NPDC020630]|uniref:sensor histidine kinase n=1 Tax=Embleya sp. NPDC020630 TaxID=3363979 RepID=UPI0037A12D52
MVSSTMRRARRFTAWSLLSAVVLVPGIPAVLAVVEAARGDNGWPLALAAVGCCGLLFATARHWAGTPPRGLLVATCAVALGVSAAALAHDVIFPWPMPLATAVGLLTMYARGRRWRVLAAGLSVVVALPILLGPSPSKAPDQTIGALVVTASVTVTCVLNDWVWRQFVELDDARRIAGELAVANERLRFAADLHDIQGHTLTLIAVKSELARRLVEMDPSAAAAQMGEVEALAREAVTDTRGLVHGYREVSFAAELANAAAVLTAAGIECHYASPPPLPDRAGTLFGLVVREATTNILRHSAATTASIDVSADGRRLTIRNDGATQGKRPGGTGLAGLDARLRGHGGELRASAGLGVFEVVARLDVADRTEAPA